MNRQALISLSNKKNIKLICKILNDYKIQIIASDNTYKKIIGLGFKAKRVKNITKYNELFEGRVKTLHPIIHGGILFKRSDIKHYNQAKKNKIPLIDFVIINLYPFTEMVSKKNSNELLIENIDIGGHALIRSAAKNFKYVTTICDYKDYNSLKLEMKKNDGFTTLNYRKKLATKAFDKISKYDFKIKEWFEKKYLQKKNKRKINLKYGENPHQKASLYINNKLSFNNFTNKKLSYNNVNDATSGIECIKDFKKPAAVIIKHASPCGLAVSTNLFSAIKKCLESDPKSSFGGILSVNNVINEHVAEKIILNFFEIVIAPNFTKKALAIFKRKKNLILLKSKLNNNLFKEYKSIHGGVIEQQKNNLLIKKNHLHCVTTKKANKNIINDMLFAINVSKHVKSNAIVIAKKNQVLGIGGGQTSRIDSISLALKKMKTNFKSKSGFVLASDGFLPFKDNIKILKHTNCLGIIQPGGSKNDLEVIKCANSLKIPMYFSKIRHFKH